MDQIQEEIIMGKMVEYIASKADRKEPFDLKDDTVYYICNIIAIMGTSNSVNKIASIMTKKTKDAFNEIGAKEYGKIFHKYFNSIMDETKSLSGLFKFFKKRKIIRKNIQALYAEIEYLNNEKPLIENYLIPYILKNYSDKVDFEAK